MIRGGHVFLSGFMGVGKSTVGPRLAEALGRPFVDLDARVQSEAQATIADIFAAEGEPGFRRREAVALAGVLDGPPAVVALGGGVVADPAQRVRIRGAGVVLTLTARLETIQRRVDGGGRPLWPDAERLLADRAAAYADADATIDTEGRAPDEVVAAALAAVARLEGRAF